MINQLNSQQDKINQEMDEENDNNAKVLKDFILRQ